MSNPVVVIFYRESSGEEWRLYGLATDTTTATKMLMEDGVITAETLAYEYNGESKVAIGNLPVKDRVKFIVQALTHRSNWFLPDFSLDIKNVYDKYDYGAGDKYYGECIDGG